jgi:hypothetical protein
MHDSVTLPDPVRFVGDTVQKVLLVVRLTTPANPLTAVIVIVEVPVTPGLTVTLVGLAVIVKSWTMYVTVTEWDNEALVPVTPTWNVPSDANVHERMELPEAGTLFGEMLHEVLLVPRPTTPAKPLTGVTIIVEVAVVPALTGMLIGFADIVKSWTTNVTVTECDSELLVPVTDTCLLPVGVNVQDRVALPEPVTVVGETVQAEVLLVARLTMPPKPFRPVIVIVEAPGALTLALTLAGLAVTVKSWTV